MSMPVTKSSNVNMTPLTPGTVSTSSSMRATEAYEPTSVPMLKLIAPSGSAMFAAVPEPSALTSAAA